MKWFNNLKIKTKLILCFIVLALITGIVGIVGIVNMSDINTKSEHMYTRDFLPSLDLAKIQAGQQNVRANQILLVYERDPERFDLRNDEINRTVEQTNELLAKLEASLVNDMERELYNNMIEALSNYRNVRNENISLIKDQKFDEALATLNRTTEARLASDGELQKLIDYFTGAAADQVASNAANFKSQTYVMTAVIIFSILLAIGLGLLLANQMSKSLNILVKGADRIADGDLDINIDIDTKDEVGILAEAFKRMTDNINEVMSNINSASEQVSSGAKQVSDSSMALSQGATEQASSIEQLTA
ncbi:MAG: methyl-accepting chemotaxis protein, partial [Bacillota bacterium]|nr:methyl-accepting chemotaxis protein [Bacillota bacterium]